jgi:hypothetical protein
MAGAIPHSLRIRFYVDGYHSYLLANAAVDLHRGFLKNMLDHFPEYSRYFDPAPDVSKKADIVVSLLRYAESRIIATEEGILGAQNRDVLPISDVERLNNSYVRYLFGQEPPQAVGRIFIQADSYGTVFRPRLDKNKIRSDIDSFINELSIDAGSYAHQLKELDHLRRQLDRGHFDASQNFYDALADIIGDTSESGFLRLSRDARRKIEIGEKGVDGDFVAALAFDAADGLADVYVLLTNDADHAPAVDRMQQRGDRVAVVTYGNRPAAALRQAAGQQNVLNLLADEREFDFDPIWLLTDNEEGRNVLEHMRMQWAEWRRRGMIR